MDDKFGPCALMLIRVLTDVTDQSVGSLLLILESFSIHNKESHRQSLKTGTEIYLLNLLSVILFKTFNQEPSPQANGTGVSTAF